MRSLGALFGRRGSYTLSPLHPPDALLQRDQDFASKGLHPKEATAIQRCANELRWCIYVRAGNPARLLHVTDTGEPLREPVRPKPAGLYQKTDKKDGRVFVDGRLFRDAAGNAFCGDIDLHGVYRKNEFGEFEEIDPELFVPAMNTALETTGLHVPWRLAPRTPMICGPYDVFPHSPIQHGAHDGWSERNNASYAGGVNMGPQPGVIRFAPDEMPRYFVSTQRYHDDLAVHGKAVAYTSEAWTMGRNRRAQEHYKRRHSSPSLRDPA